MNQSDTQRITVRGLGLAASVAEPVILGVAREVQEKGFHSFWLNNPPGAAALRVLGEVAPQVPGLWLGVGVIPLTHEGPEDIVAQVQRNEIPLDRFYLGIGSGSGPGGVERVAEGIARIRARLDCTIVVAALGPRMCKLAGQEADGVL